MNTGKIFFWACDYKSNSGEGRLGRLFIRQYKNKSKIKPEIIKLPKSKILNHKYVSPFIGIIFAWLYFLNGKKFLFLNYIPYWNFFIFLLLPPNSEIGPITGGAKFTNKSKDFKIRNNIFPILYNFSNLIVRFRFKKLFFSTDLLKKFLNKRVIKKSEFNYIFHEIKNNKINIIRNKNIKLLIYYRKHKNKDYEFINKLIEKLILKKNIIHVVGDKLDLYGVKNHGIISHNRVINLLKKTKYSISSSENIFSFFTIDCINNNVKILVNDINYRSIKNYKKNFVKFDFKKNNIKILK